MYDFDQIIPRRNTYSEKWDVFAEDVLPLWVADMDFLSPEPVIRALHERVEHGVYGYGVEPKELPELLVARLAALYGWKVPASAIVFVPGVVTGFSVAARAVTRPGDGLLVQTPVYSPMLEVASNWSLEMQEMELSRQVDGRYSIEMDRMAAAMNDRTAAFILCNPHNPVGRVFRRDELDAMADLCLRRDVTIISDEIHCDLIFSGYQHIPIASLAPEVEAKTITLMAPSKTFNIAGLGCSFAVIPDAGLRERFKAAGKNIVPHVSVLGFTAALAAYREGAEWLAECLRYLEANRNFTAEFVSKELPGLRMSPMEATYLAWLDCRAANLSDKPAHFFAKHARVGLNDGSLYGHGGSGFVRLNFGCPRATLVEALERMARALETGS